MKIAIHGNCQSVAIEFLLRATVPHWQTTVIQVHNCPLDDATRAKYVAAIAAADVVLHQPVSADYRGVEWLSGEFVAAQARPGAAVLRYPSIYYAGFMQGYATMRDAKGHLLSHRDTEPLLPIVDGILAGADDDAIMARLLDPDLIPPAAVERFHQDAIDALQRREAAAEVHLPVSPYLAAHRAIRKTLHTYNHPYRHVLADLLNRAMRLLSVAARVLPEGPDTLSFVRMPCLPAVARSFAETADEAVFVAMEERSSREAYFRNAIANLRGKPRERLAELYAPHAADWRAMAAA